MTKPAKPAANLSSRHDRNAAALGVAPGLIFTEGGSFHRSAIDANDPPVLILHGTADPVVPFVLGQLLDLSLTDAGVAHEFVPLEGWGHSAWGASVDGRTLNQIALDFIATHGQIVVKAATP